MVETPSWGISVCVCVSSFIIFALLRKGVNCSKSLGFFRFLVLFKQRNKSSKRSSLFLVHVMGPGGGELSLSVCPGVGNRTSSTQMPGGVPGGDGNR